MRALAIGISWAGKDEQSPNLGSPAVRKIAEKTTTISKDPAKTGERAKLVTPRLTRASDNALLGTSSWILGFYYDQMKRDGNFDSGLLTLDGYARGNYYTYRCRTQQGSTAGCT